MITTHRVFEDTHLPHRYPHRDAAVNHLHRQLAQSIDGDPAADLLISGPSGVGKTSLARYALTKLTEQAPIQTAYVRCLGSTTGQLLRALQRALTSDPVPENRPVDDVHDTLEATLTRPAVVILDEADELPQMDVLARLQALPYLSMIIIIHDPTHWLPQVGTDMAHRLDGETHITLDRYSVDELADILEDRASRSLPALSRNSC